MNYFSNVELRCKCCGSYQFNQGTLDKLNKLRHDLGFPLPVTSGYRCKEYNDMIGATQTHATGQAVDIAVSRQQAYELIALAPEHGFTGIGIKQHGDGRFIHLDDLASDPEENRVRPMLWGYK